MNVTLQANARHRRPNELPVMYELPCRSYPESMILRAPRADRRSRRGFVLPQ